MDGAQAAEHVGRVDLVELLGRLVHPLAGVRRHVGHGREVEQRSQKVGSLGRQIGQRRHRALSFRRRRRYIGRRAFDVAVVAGGCVQRLVPQRRVKDVSLVEHGRSVERAELDDFDEGGAPGSGRLRRVGRRRFGGDGLVVVRRLEGFLGRRQIGNLQAEHGKAAGVETLSNGRIDTSIHN